MASCGLEKLMADVTKLADEIISGGKSLGGKAQCNFQSAWMTNGRFIGARRAKHTEPLERKQRPYERGNFLDRLPA